MTALTAPARTKQPLASVQAHVVRAMLEAMCFQTREVSEAMCRDAQKPALQVLPLSTPTRPPT